jgi:hypothetical protein
MNESHYLSEKVCSNESHVENGCTIRYKTDNKCVLCRKERRAKFKDGEKPPTLYEQIEILVSSETLPDTCIDWWGAYYSNGYGHVTKNKKDMLAHRVSLSIFLGELIPVNLQVCHECDRPSCINPKHLFVGTSSDNMQDCLNKGRFSKESKLKGEDHPNARLTKEEVAEIRVKYKPRIYTIKHLAKEYSVSESLIAKIINNKLWID